MVCSDAQAGHNPHETPRFVATLGVGCGSRRPPGPLGPTVTHASLFYSVDENGLAG